MHTGFYDKNDNPIFEGDIILTGEGTHTVCFKNGAFVTEHGTSLEQRVKGCEIIGSIHE